MILVGGRMVVMRGGKPRASGDDPIVSAFPALADT